MTHFLRRLLVLVTTLAAPLTLAADAQREPLVVFAAASLTDVLQQVGPLYTKQSNVPVKFSFAASSALAKQIESGAQVDVFFSADQDWMNYLQGRQLINAGSRTDLLGNRLALIAPKDSKVSLKLERGAKMLSALGADGRLATGDPDSVPVGKYAKTALTNLGLWPGIEPRLVRAENVRVALMYVARGETPLGIVYATDAAVEPQVRIVDVFPESSHAPISYPVAATSKAAADTASFVAFLRSDAARAVFTRAGFNILASSQHAHANAGGCGGFRFDVSKELKLFETKPQAINAGTTANAATGIQADRLYALTLSEQSKVKFATEPGKPTVAGGSYAGVLKVDAPRSATIRVSASEAAWLDVISGGKPVESTRHTGSGNCPALRKVVEFKVTPATPLLLQVSGSTDKQINVAVTTS